MLAFLEFLAMMAAIAAPFVLGLLSMGRRGGIQR